MRKHEYGRSMVEILAVLAVVGILSIGGIAGYKLAVQRYQISDLVNKVTKFAFLVFEQCNIVYKNHSTSLESVAHCTANTPGIKTYTETGIGIIPPYIYPNGIRFTGINFDEEKNKYNIIANIRFQGKEH